MLAERCVILYLYARARCFRVRMQGGRILDCLCQRTFHLHSDADHQRKVVRDHLRSAPQQAT